MLQLTVQDILDRTYVQLRENGANPEHWSDNELIQYLNDMMVDVAERAQCFRVQAGIEIEANIRRYLVPSNILVPTRMEYDGEYLDAASVEDLDESDSNWRERTGTPYVWFVELAPAGYVDLYRVPSDDGDQTTFSIDYGVVTGISDGVNTYTFSSDYGLITGVSSSGDELVEENSDYGVVTGWFSNSGNLLVTGYGYPDEVTDRAETLPRPIHGNHMIATAYLTYRAFLREGKGHDAEKSQIYFQQYTEQVERLRVKPKTATRRRFVRRRREFDIPTRIGPAVPSTIES